MPTWSSSPISTQRLWRHTVPISNNSNTERKQHPHQRRHLRKPCSRENTPKTDSFANTPSPSLIRARATHQPSYCSLAIYCQHRAVSACTYHTHVPHSPRHRPPSGVSGECLRACRPLPPSHPAQQSPTSRFDSNTAQFRQDRTT